MDLMSIRRGLMAQMAQATGMFSKTLTMTVTIEKELQFSSQTIQHSLGVAPDFCFMYLKDRQYPPAGQNMRLFQCAFYTNLGMHLDGDAWRNDTFALCRLYDNTTAAKYYQVDAIRSAFNNITSSSLTIGPFANGGFRPGEYVLFLGKIAPDYAQGEATEYNN